MATDLGDQIEDTAAGPSQASGDGQSMTAQPIPDLIAADNHQAGKAALAGTNNKGGPKSPWGRVTRPGRVIPPGSV